MAAIMHPRSWLERRRARREADYWIAHGFESRHPWRVAELTSVRERNLSARALRGVLGELDGSKLPGATPLRRGALREHVRALETVEQRLLDDEPVSAVGMLAVADLLTSPDSCLFAPVADVGACLRDIIEKLEVR